MAEKGEVAKGDVIQIDPDGEVKEFFKAKLAIVDEVKGFGVMAYVAAEKGDSYVRLTWEQFEVIGQAVWVHGEAVE